VVLIAPFINLAFPGGLYEFSCSTSFRNEEFVSLQTSKEARA